jgi:hypothetical protein
MVGYTDDINPMGISLGAAIEAVKDMNTELGLKINRVTNSF